MQTLQVASAEPAAWSEPALPGQPTPPGFGHPTDQSPLSQIIEHVVAVHHRFLRIQLLQMERSLDRLRLEDTGWRDAEQLFAELQAELIFCALREERVVFPQIARLEERRFPSLELASRLVTALRWLETSHVASLRMLWLLQRQTEGISAKGAAASQASQQFAADLALLCDDYYQHLYEEECLLFPRVQSLVQHSDRCSCRPDDLRPGDSAGLKKSHPR